MPLIGVEGPLGGVVYGCGRVQVNQGLRPGFLMGVAAFVPTMATVALHGMHPAVAVQHMQLGLLETFMVGFGSARTVLGSARTAEVSIPNTTRRSNKRGVPAISIRSNVRLMVLPCGLRFRAWLLTKL